ncbi:MAG: DNA polymerase I [Candidatus Omnitrophica bacterium]|nr:DNA polymerase I [Candidatus Omnitrophota bacterium]
MSSNESAYFIDASNYIYRAYYALPALNNSKGIPTNAVYGFLTMLKKLIKEKTPDYLAIAFDHKAPSFRKDLYSGYKATRKPAPDKLISQILTIKDIIKKYNIAAFELKGYEADDILASLAKNAARKGLSVFIVSSDKDIVQTVDNNISIYDPKKNLVLNKNNIKDFYPIEPEFFADFLALKGDKTDNVPGIPGIGEAMAQEIITKYGTIEKIIDSTAMMPDKEKSLIENNKDQLLLSKQLTKLNTEIDLNVNLQKIRIKEPNYCELITAFEELEFNNMTKELLSELNYNLNIKQHILKTRKELIKITEDIRARGYFSFVAGQDSVVLCINNAVWVLPGRLIPENRDLLNGIFNDKTLEKISYQIKDFYKEIKKYGISIENPVFDLAISAYLLNPSWQKYELFRIALNYAKDGLKLAALLINKNNSGKDLDEKISACYVIDKIYPEIFEKLRIFKLDKLYYEIESQLIFILSEMEEQGIRVDTTYLLGLLKDYDKKIASISKDIYQACQEKFNLNSPKQLGTILYQKLNLKPIKKGKTGPSTDEETLKKLSCYHPVADMVLKYRELSKIKNTYIEGLLKNVSESDNKIHPTFNQTTAQTGRLTCSNPNLQNIPIRSELGRQIRRAFVPSKENDIFISADYSQIELRILAHLSKDPGLQEAFKKNKDVHKHTAALIFGLKEDAIDDAMRSAAKTVNFGIIYGISPYGLAKQLGVSIPEAADFIDSYFALYPKVKEYMQTEIDKSRRSGYTSTLFNRRRYVPEINSPDTAIREFGERIAVNTPVQGTSADLIKKVMVTIASEIKRENMAVTLILQIHDELLYQTDIQNLKTAQNLIKDKMENTLILDIPLKVNITSGPNWLELN